MATIKNAIAMQDRMSPVFNKMLTAMSKTLDVMGELDKTTNNAMHSTSGIKHAQEAIKAARADVAGFRQEIEALNSKSVSLKVNAPIRANAPAVSAAQMATTPPAGVLSIAAAQNTFTPLSQGAIEAQAAVKKVQASIDAIRGPDYLANSFTQAGAQGSNAGRVIAEAMAKAQSGTSKLETTGSKATKSLEKVSQQATTLGGNNFGGKMQQQLKRATKETDNLNRELQETEKRATSAGNSMQLLNVAAGVSLARQMWDTVSGASAYLDKLSQINARLNSINDGTQTLDELQGKILASANRSRGSYQDMADTVAKLNLLAADAFKSNDEAIAFAEQMNKMFVVSGASAQETSAAMYQLNQALASGRLQGDEFRSIIENAPMMANAIAKSMGVSRAELKDMSSDGAITADVIKKAMFDCADEVNAKFNSMPLTFGQAMTKLQNLAASKFQAVADMFSSMINSGDIQVIADAIGGVITTAAWLAVGAIKALSTALKFLQDNLSIIGPIIAGVAAALAVYYGQLLLTATAQGILTAAKMVAVPIYAALTGATMAETAAQWGLNTAMYACPITWIVIAIIALIAVIYVAINAMNEFAGTSVSATGVVVGVFFALGASIWNVIANLWNTFASIAEFFVNVWNHPVYAVKSLFGNLVKNSIDMFTSFMSGIDGVATGLANAFITAANVAVKAINWIIGALNHLPMVDIGTVKEFDKIASINSTLKDVSKDVDKWIGEEPKDYWKAPKMELKNISDSYENGYKWGENFEKSISNLGDFGIKEAIDNAGLDKLNGALGNIASAAEKPKGGKLDSIGKIEKDVELSDEDIKMLKDIASTKFINKFTTLQPNMTVTFGDVHENADIDKIMEAIGTMTEQALAETVLEGVY